MANNGHSSHQSWIVPIVVALIGAAGVVIAAWISRPAVISEGIQLVQQTVVTTQQVIESQAAPVGKETQVAEIVSTPEPFQALPIVVTPPAIAPTPTLLPDTPSGTVLELGQTWKQGEFEIRLEQVGQGTNWVKIRFAIKSRKSYDVAISYDLNNVSSRDNNGHNIQMTNYKYSSGCVDQKARIAPNKELPMICAYGAAEILIHADLTDPESREIIVNYSDNNVGIENARWIIPILH